MYQQTYRIRNEHTNTEPPRVVDVHATPDQIRHLVDEGYLIRERLIQGELLQTLRDAADALEAEALARTKPGEEGGFGGLFVRGLLDRHPVFLEHLLQFAPTLSVARAVLGPQVQIHGSVLRVAYPHLSGQGVEWHFHQRVVPEPLPPFFYRPALIDNLIYLDDITPESGPLVVMPRSHRLDEDLPTGDHSDKPGQVVVTFPAGSCITSHSGLWHKALAPRSGSVQKRRLLILGYSPVWMKPIDPFTALYKSGEGDGLSNALRNSDNREIRELIGVAGYY